MEDPLLLAGANVEASHIAGRHLRRKGNVIDLRTHDDDIAANDGRGGDAVQMAIDTATKPLRQVDTPFVAEGGNDLARRGVQADQVAVAGAEQNASILSFRPVGDAAMYEAVIGRCSVLPCLWVVYPKGLARCSVDCRDLGE